MNNNFRIIDGEHIHSDFIYFFMNQIQQKSDTMREIKN